MARGAKNDVKGPEEELPLSNLQGPGHMTIILFT